MPDSTYHQIHFAWAEPTLLGRVGPGPAASSFKEAEQPVLRSWRDRLIPALTADHRSAPSADGPSDHPESLWARAYPDGRAALVYRWPGDVRSAHALAIVGPTYALTLPHVLSLHENPHTRPAAGRPPKPGWATMDPLPLPQPWERTATPGAVRTRDRRAAEVTVGDEPILVGAVAAALYRPDQPIHIALEPELADLWRAVQLRFLWGVHRTLYEVLTPPRAIPAAGWSWSFSTYDPVLGAAEGQHLTFGPPAPDTHTPFLLPPAPDYRGVAERLVAVLREEGGDALAAHLRERGVPEAPTFADRRDLLRDWLDPRPRPTADGAAEAPLLERPPDEDPPDSLPDLPEAEMPGEEETGPLPPVEPRPLPGRTALGWSGRYLPAGAVPGGQPSLKGLLDQAEGHGTKEHDGRGDAPPHPTRSQDETDGRDNEALWPGSDPEPPPETTDPAEPEEPLAVRPRIAPPRIFSAPEPHGPRRSPGSQATPETSTTPDQDPRDLGDEAPPAPSQDVFGTGGAVGGDTTPPPEALAPQEPPRTPDGGVPTTRPDTPPLPQERKDTEPPTSPELTDGPEDRTPADAPPLPVVPDPVTDDAVASGASANPSPDYATETEPGIDEISTDTDPEDNWPTQYADLPLSRLERWHSRHGPEGARVDIVDARAAVRAERAELQRVREERDHYHTEVQELRREVARLDRSWLEGRGRDDDAPAGRRTRRWPARVLALVILAAFLATGLEAGARFGTGTVDLLGALLGRLL